MCNLSHNFTQNPIFQKVLDWFQLRRSQMAAYHFSFLFWETFFWEETQILIKVLPCSAQCKPFPRVCYALQRFHYWLHTRVQWGVRRDISRDCEGRQTWGGLVDRTLDVWCVQTIMGRLFFAAFLFKQESEKKCGIFFKFSSRSWKFNSISKTLKMFFHGEQWGWKKSASPSVTPYNILLFSFNNTSPVFIGLVGELLSKLWS